MSTRDDDTHHHDFSSVKTLYMDVKNSHAGYMLLEALIALQIFVLIVIIFIHILTFLTRVDMKPSVVQTDIALIQLKSRLRLAKVTEITTEKFCFIRFESSFCLELIQRKLVKTPGTEIFIRDVDLLVFYETNDCVMLKVVSNETIWNQCIYTYN